MPITSQYNWVKKEFPRIKTRAGEWKGRKHSSEGGWFEMEIVDMGSSLMTEVLGWEHVSEWLRGDGREDHWS